MSKLIIKGSASSFTPIPNVFIDRFMPKANPAYACVYIYAYRHMSADISIGDIAGALSLIESDVMRAFKYWETEGLVRFLQSGDSFELEFLPLSAQPEQARLIMETRPVYSMQELERYKDNSKEIENLFIMAQKMLGLSFNSNDLSVIFALHDWLRLPTDVIGLLIKYCCDNDHRSIRYIEKVAIDWSNNGINTIDAALEHLKLYNGDYRKIMQAIGQSKRDPTDKETEFMKSWLKDKDMPLELVVEACEKCIMQNGKPNFQYIDKIIENWHKEGLKTLDDVKRFEEKYRQENPIQKKQKIQSKQNRFVNFTQRKYDYAEIEKLEFEKNSREASNEL